MLKIRMQRIGRTNTPAFRIVVAEHTIGPKSGRFLERVGSYNPKTKERALDADRIKYWISKGAQASGTMHNMLVTAGVISGKKINVLPKKTVPKKEEAAAIPQAQVAKDEPKSEASAEETKSE